MEQCATKYWRWVACPTHDTDALLSHYTRSIFTSDFTSIRSGVMNRISARSD